MTSKAVGPRVRPNKRRSQREQVGGDEGGTGVTVGRRSTSPASRLTATAVWPIRCSAAAIRGATARIQHPGPSGSEHVDEPGLALQVCSVGELAGEPIDVEVPAVTGDGSLQRSAAVGTGRAGHLRMMARSRRPERRW